MGTNGMRAAAGGAWRGSAGWARLGRLARLGALGLAAALLAATGLGLVAGAVAKARLQALYPPPGRLVDVGGYRLHIDCAGSGGPTVILDAGAGGFGPHWALVQPALAAQTTVCTYDRAGLGWSDASPRPRTPAMMAEELAALLEGAGVGGPYILVAHSLGGTVVRQFALAHPHEVAGMVLVDSASEQQIGRFPAPIREAGAGQMLPLRLVNLAASAGLLALNPALFPTPPQLPAESAEAIRALTAAGGKVMGAMRAEIAGAMQDRTAPLTTLGDIPLIVLRHGRSELQPQGAITPELVQQYEALWAQMQGELAALSPRGRVVVAEDSGHLIPLEQPELVVAAVEEVLRAAR